MKDIEDFAVNLRVMLLRYRHTHTHARTHLIVIIHLYNLKYPPGLKCRVIGNLVRPKTCIAFILNTKYIVHYTKYTYF